MISFPNIYLKLLVFGLTVIVVAGCDNSVPTGHLASTEWVAQMVANGGDIDARRFGAISIMRFAVTKNDLAYVETLLKHGADPNVRDNVAGGRTWDVTPLHEAATFGFDEIAAALIRHGAMVNAMDSRGNTPLLRAADQHAGVVQILLDAKADPMQQNRLGWTPLHEAASGGQLSIVKALIDHDVKIDAQDSQGNTPLYRAAATGHVYVVELLLRAGADTEIEGFHGTPLEAALARRPRKGDPPINRLNDVIEVLSRRSKRPGR